MRRGPRQPGLQPPASRLPPARRRTAARSPQVALFRPTTLAAGALWYMTGWTVHGGGADFDAFTGVEAKPESKPLLFSEG